LTKNVEEKVHHDHGKQNEGTSALTPYILMLALTIHSIFEGFAIGL